MDHENHIDSAQLQSLQQAFRDQLLACLEECTRGRHGLFSDVEHLPADTTEIQPWPEAARLRELAFALQSILAQSETSDPLCDQFLDLCTIHGEYDPGEPKLARAFLQQIESGM
ncbi:hypothetical protein ACFPT7_16370 [Acidicapsa dinghuensis]|uniref:Tetratricopeptide repeat protein n=1 Tax=Acidicapsa dinghuensis TaxID=2218256 RepID=A0ABW1EI82_9BACT|nr:hypothetical protein [Acidicapsa dinghuensis]